MTRDSDNQTFALMAQRWLAAEGHYGGRIDGWAGARTREAFAEATGGEVVAGFPLDNFRGDLARVHAWEGHNGKPYWPGGASGVTLDPGFDLGRQAEAALRDFYDFLPSDDLDALATVIGLRGERAKAAIRVQSRLRSIRISRADALRVMPHLAAGYWRAITDRFPAIAADNTPPSVQTAMLSLAYNRGAGNNDLDILGPPIAQGEWERVADLIGGMQQTHRLAGIRRRRREEAGVIRDELA